MDQYLSGGYTTPSTTENEGMSEEEFLLMDRITKVRSIVGQYGKDNFSISFSGGKDSCVLSKLVEMALGEEDDIPRVYVDTGIDLNVQRKFVYDLAKKDPRIVIVKPHTPIKQTLERVGYPFKSKNHARLLERYQRNKEKGLPMMDSIKSYLGQGDWGPRMQCPKILRYQFDDNAGLNFKASDQCCYELKERPIAEWQKANNRPYTMIGLMQEEGGRRANAACLAFQNGKLRAFQPLVVLSKAWEDWFIKRANIELSEAYTEYHLPRTGCKGCPFALNLAKELELLEKISPIERAQCEIIWKPVYDEYRRIGYRLPKAPECQCHAHENKKEIKKKTEPTLQIGEQLSIFDVFSFLTA